MWNEMNNETTTLVILPITIKILKSCFKLTAIKHTAVINWFT